MKKALLVNDLAGIGKITLHTASPLFSISQIETALLLTTILSSHTGGFTNIYKDNYTEGMQQFLAQWMDLELNFDAVVTGYFSENKQIDLLRDYLEKKLPNCPLIVDPVMADNGRLYQGFEQTYIHKLKELVAKANLVLPNITEACFLTDTVYRKEGIDERYLEDLSQKLIDLGAKKVVLTGIPFSDTIIGMSYYDATTQELHYYQEEKIGGHFTGTGDLMTTLLAICHIKGLPLEKAIPNMMTWMNQTLRYTLTHQTDLRMGILYEPFILELVGIINQLLKENVS
ncbi:pyridoxine kinase [Granulicatella balaenopterae]|uniref:pyridoxal kinase n=1 Tax=Granulicatella balaenopterae TaxID=137733 RepID=A0A1H9KU75_9LACT|nr:pyridoxamine kinase [Granulicatella balaenopterae]SER02608.1 pyridoxine kinase [Granulicatella balaenopterae]